VFLYDATGGNWVPFAVIALLGQAGGVAWLVRKNNNNNSETNGNRSARLTD
jgi:hypothetical protein